MRACDALRTKCVEGITANKAHCKKLVEYSIGIVTALKPYLGYAKITEVAQEAQKTGGSVYQLVLDKGFLTKEQLDKIMDPVSYTHLDVYKRQG